MPNLTCHAGYLSLPPRADASRIETNARVLRLGIAILALAVPPALFGQAGNTSTFSTSRTQTLHTTSTTAEANNYLTRLTARIGTAGPLLYDQSFNAQLADATVQAAIQQARAQLTNAGATSIAGPNLQSNSRTLTGTTLSTVTNSTQTTQDLGSEFVIGPGTAITGDRGLCTGLTGVVGSRLPTGCPGGTPVFIPGGSSNTNINTNTQSDIFQTVTTTSTFLTSQTYELTGTAAPVPPATPAPPSFWLALTGGAAAGLSALGKRFRNRKDS